MDEALDRKDKKTFYSICDQMKNIIKINYIKFKTLDSKIKYKTRGFILNFIKHYIGHIHYP